MAGTYKKAFVEGFNYNVRPDSDATLVGGGFENNPIPHSGGTAVSKVRRSAALTGLTLYVSAQEDERLRASQGKNNISIGYEDADGNIYRAIGFINYSGMTAQENTATLDLHPRSVEGFALFAA
jgi:hypothetical protein